MVCAKLSGIHEQFLGLWKMKVPFYRALYFEHWVNLRDPLSRFRITDCDLLRPSALKKGLPSPSLIQALPSASLVPQALIDGFSGCARRHGVWSLWCAACTSTRTGSYSGVERFAEVVENYFCCAYENCGATNHAKPNADGKYARNKLHGLTAWIAEGAGASGWFGTSAFDLQKTMCLFGSRPWGKSRAISIPNTAM